MRITPITNNLFAAPAAMATRTPAVQQNKPAQPAFGLGSISFGGKAARQPTEYSGLAVWRSPVGH